MSPWFRRTTTFIVQPLPSKSRPWFYRATHRGHSAYGRTKSEAINRSYKRYQGQKFRIRDVFNLLGWSIIS